MVPDVVLPHISGFLDHVDLGTEVLGFLLLLGPVLKQAVDLLGAAECERILAEGTASQLLLLARTFAFVEFVPLTSFGLLVWGLLFWFSTLLLVGSGAPASESPIPVSLKGGESILFAHWVILDFFFLHYKLFVFSICSIELDFRVLFGELRTLRALASISIRRSLPASLSPAFVRPVDAIYAFQLGLNPQIFMVVKAAAHDSAVKALLELFHRSLALLQDPLFEDFGRKIERLPCVFIDFDFYLFLYIPHILGNQIQNPVCNSSFKWLYHELIALSRVKVVRFKLEN